MAASNITLDPDRGPLVVGQRVVVTIEAVIDRVERNGVKFRAVAVGASLERGSVLPPDELAAVRSPARGAPSTVCESVGAVAAVPEPREQTADSLAGWMAEQRDLRHRRTGSA